MLDIISSLFYDAYIIACNYACRNNTRGNDNETLVAIPFIPFHWDAFTLLLHWKQIFVSMVSNSIFADD